MGLFLESGWSEVVLGVLLLQLLVVVYFLYKFGYWERRGVPYVRPVFPFGNFTNSILRRKSIGLVVKDIYDEFRKGGRKFGGFYVLSSPTFMPVDPEVVKMVMTKDFGSFHNRGIYHNEEGDPLSAHLLTIEDQKWRNLRTKLTPTFTSGKMKMMFQTFVECSKELGMILNDVSGKEGAIDIKDIAARFTTDIIGTCAFGLDCNSLKNPDSEFRIYGKKFFELSFLENIKRNVQILAPSLVKYFNLSVVPEDMSKFFLDVIKQTVAYREANQVDRKDMMSLLLKLKNNESLDDDKKLGKDETGITINQLAAQCFVFFLGGFETSSTTMSFLLFELSQHQDIQDKLRDEIRQVLAKHSGQITYEAIMEMTYMDKVINETLRMHPPLSILTRVANEDWKVPGSDVVIEKGTKVIISNYGMQMDPEYYPNPEMFDPERFSEQNKSKRHSYCFLPFGEGPRSCIGMRFGLMQTKVGLTVFLKDHRYELDPRTSPKIKYDEKSFVLTHKDGIWLKTIKI